MEGYQFLFTIDTPSLFSRPSGIGLNRTPQVLRSPIASLGEKNRLEHL